MRPNCVETISLVINYKETKKKEDGDANLTNEKRRKRPKHGLNFKIMSSFVIYSSK